MLRFHKPDRLQARRRYALAAARSPHSTRDAMHVDAWLSYACPAIRYGFIDRLPADLQELAAA
jgi:hypothetical protein